MKERSTTGEPVKKKTEQQTLETTYYTIKGQQDDFDEKGYPVQTFANDDTYAKSTGKKKLLRVDDRGQFINPLGLYHQRSRLDRFIPVSEKAFAYYLEFLKTKDAKYVLLANRETDG